MPKSLPDIKDIDFIKLGEAVREFAKQTPNAQYPRLKDIIRAIGNHLGIKIGSSVSIAFSELFSSPIPSHDQNKIKPNERLIVDITKALIESTEVRFIV